MHIGFVALISALAPTLSLAWLPHRVGHHSALIPTAVQRHRNPVMLAKKSGGGGGDGGGKGGDDDGRQRQKKGAGVQTITIDKVDTTLETELKQELDEEGWWRVLLHNDEVHSFEYVTEAIVKVVPQITRKKAFLISRTVHMNGVGTITTVWQTMAEQLCMGLQTFGLTVSISPDANFDNQNEGGDNDEKK
mmetsp:Transcript_412/g.914  ORF Transcript_412/g.914 Transcript_412/m.914 type:complete len:191 (+) Transcript_412:90-662(+)